MHRKVILFLAGIFLTNIHTCLSSKVPDDLGDAGVKPNRYVYMAPNSDKFFVNVFSAMEKGVYQLSLGVSKGSAFLAPIAAGSALLIPHKTILLNASVALNTSRFLPNFIYNSRECFVNQTDEKVATNALVASGTLRLIQTGYMTRLFGEFFLVPDHYRLMLYPKTDFVSAPRVSFFNLTKFSLRVSNVVATSLSLAFMTVVQVIPSLENAKN